MRVDTLSSMCCVASVALLAACGSGPGPQQAVPAAADGGPAMPASHDSPASPAAAKTETLAQVSEDVPLALPKLLGHSPEEVTALLGESLGPGMDRGTCVRFTPKRVFFACEYALRPHADKTGTFNKVVVTYEDGLATEVAFDGLKAGSGPFDPKVLLSAIGLTLPESGELSNPRDKVRLWSWFNSLARLRVAGKEYRVELSVVEDDWSRARVSVMQNDHLTPAQQAKVLADDGAQASEPPKP